MLIVLELLEKDMLKLRSEGLSGNFIISLFRNCKWTIAEHGGNIQEPNTSNSGSLKSQP